MLIARSVHPLPGEAERKERLLALVDGFSSRRIVVVGDLIADEFIYGEVSRVSREAPVLIVKYDASPKPIVAAPDLFWLDSPIELVDPPPRTSIASDRGSAACRQQVLSEPSFRRRPAARRSRAA